MKRYRDFNSYLKKKFGTKVYKIALDAGLSCPNRDGTLSKEGCVFCKDGSAALYISQNLSLSEQIDLRMKLIKKKHKEAKFLAYLQAFSNTYAPLKKLDKIYREALSCPEVVGLSIGTRPDCVNEGKIELIAEYAENHEVWLEYGLQSIHQNTLRLINRRHTLQDFEKAVKMTKHRGIKICVHIILGLPEESKQEMLETARFIAALNIQGIKIHLLHVIRDTPLHTRYLKGEINLLGKVEYLSLVCDILEILPETMVIHRLTGEADKKLHVAPLWALEKNKVLKEINEELRRRDSYQGKSFAG